jgi:enamine deaminase RidA (YjgF/YER057c/UK114 family)
MSLYPDPPYEYSAAAHGMIFTAGACPLDDPGRVAEPGDREAQAARAADNLLAALAERGADAASLLKTTIYVVADEREDLGRVWDIVAARLGRAPSTLLGVAFLGYPDQLVEIEAVAAAGGGGPKPAQGTVPVRGQSLPSTRDCPRSSSGPRTASGTVPDGDSPS